MRVLSLKHKMYISAALMLLLLHALTAQEKPLYAFRFPTGGRLIADPIIDKNHVWILAEGRQLYTVTETGTVIGKGTTAVSKPAFAVNDKLGRLLITDGNTKAELYNEQCRLVWSISFNRNIRVPPLFDANGFLYLCIGADVLCYTPGGKLRTRFNLPSVPQTACIAGKGDAEALYVALQAQNNESFIVSVSLKTLSSRSWKMPDVPSLCTASAHGVIASIGGKLLLFNHAHETPIPLADFPAPVTAMAFTGNNGVVLLKNNILSLISETRVIWSIQVKASPDVSLFLTPERIILYDKTRAQSFSIKGELFREINITNSATKLVPGNSGVIVSGGEDWILYVYQFEQFTTKPIAAVPHNEPFPARTILASEMTWLTSGYSDESFLPYLDRGELALQRYEPLSQTDYAMLLVAAASLDADPMPLAQKNLSIPLRVRACLLLSRDGNPASIPFLLETALKETDDALIAAALNAIADIGLDPYDIVLKKLAYNFKIPLFSQSALALIRCITNLLQAQGISNYKLEAASILTRLQDSRFPELVRKKAQEAQLILLKQ